MTLYKLFTLAPLACCLGGSARFVATQRWGRPMKRWPKPQRFVICDGAALRARLLLSGSIIQSSFLRKNPSLLYPVS